MFPYCSLITGHFCLTGAIAVELDKDVAIICKSQPFSLLCDKSNKENRQRICHTCKNLW
uniref:Uncharacterized protein n=1 Tax=Anguilla anguilla TaxID=7936 RepID=A0A0E9SYX3_ANGAN